MDMVKVKKIFSDGHWALWGEWSDCPATCGPGLIQKRTRVCGDPEPGTSGIKVCSSEGLGVEFLACQGVPTECPNGKHLLDNDCCMYSISVSCSLFSFEMVSFLK